MSKPIPKEQVIIYERELEERLEELRLLTLEIERTRKTLKQWKDMV